MLRASQPQRDAAIILRSRPLREADLLVHCLTATGGKLVGVAAHARRSRKRFGGVLGVGTVGELTFTPINASDLVRMDALHLRAAPPAVSHDLIAFGAYGIALDLVDTMAQAGQGGGNKFTLVTQMLSHVGCVAPDRLLFHFLIHWLTLAGFDPQWEECVTCHRAVSLDEPIHFLVEEGGIRCQTCGHGDGWRVSLDATVRQSWCREARSQSPTVTTPLDAATRAFCRTTLWQYLYHIMGRGLVSSPYWDMIWTDPQARA
jgi:DNA repair protein RecO (recombination protein O)